MVDMIADQILRRLEKEAEQVKAEIRFRPCPKSIFPSCCFGAKLCESAGGAAVPRRPPTCPSYG